MNRSDLFSGLAILGVLALCCGWHVLIALGGAGILSGFFPAKTVAMLVGGALLAIGLIVFLANRKHRACLPANDQFNSSTFQGREAKKENASVETENHR